MRFLFAEHTLDTDRCELLRGSAPIAVEPQVFDLLVHLLRNRDRVVSKDDLIASVWGGRIVSDSTLASRINAARKAVGDSGDEQRLIRTVARKGVRFIGEVRVPVIGEDPVHDAGSPPAGQLQRSRTAMPPPDRPAIAVLPFVNMSGGPEQDYFSDGISEDIITALSKLRWFFVIARNSSFTFRGKQVHLKQIAEELGVGYVVEGSVRKSGDRVRITVQLSDVETGSHLWAERYDRALTDVFAVQDEITDAIVAAIEPQVYAAENFHAQRKSPESLSAWDLVMRALSHYWRLTREDNFLAQTLLEKAIAIDPNYGQALGVLAVSHTFGAHMAWEDRATAIPVAERFAMAAARADSENPWAHLALASVYVYRGRFDEALAECELALRLNPNFSLAYGFCGLVLSYCGRWQQGADAARRALRLSPRDPQLPLLYFQKAVALEVLGNYPEEIKWLEKTVDLVPNTYVAAWLMLAAEYALAGRQEEAHNAYLRAVSIPGNPVRTIADHRALNARVRPSTDPATVTAQEREYEGLRKAGMPEE